MRTIFLGKSLIGNTSNDIFTAENQAVYIIDGRVSLYVIGGMYCQAPKNSETIFKLYENW